MLAWHTDECPGDPVVGTFNAPVDWQIVGDYIDWLTMEPASELIGEPTYTVNNTVVSSSGGVLRFDPDDPELDSCEISWTTTHQDAFGVQFTVPIHIYDLSGNEVYTHTETNVPLGAHSWTWDGTIFEQEPGGPTTAAQGIYTYRLGLVGPWGGPGEGVRCVCTDEPSCARGDWDKSAFVTVGIDKFYWFEQDPVAGTLKGVVKYTLNHNAAPDSVTIRFFGPDLEELAGAACPLEEQPYTAGTHFSGVYELNVQYDENDQLIGPIYCVLYADEGEADALLNRDRGVAKPALQRGTSQLTLGESRITPSGPVMISTVHDDDYPLEEQTVDGQVTVTASFDKEWAGQTIHLAVFDPPDMSPYVSDPQDWEAIWTDEANWGDNVDGPGTLSTTEATAVLVGQGQEQEALVTTVLTITDHAAGDNYVVAAQPGEAPTIRRAMAEFDGGAGHLLVAWARKYYTVGEMCQSGSELVANAPAGITYLMVNDVTGFQVGDEIQVFDGWYREGECAEIAAIDQGANKLTLTEPLANSYYGQYWQTVIPKGWVVRVVEDRWRLRSNWSETAVLSAYGDVVAHWNGVEAAAPGERGNGACFTDWRPLDGPFPLPFIANPHFDIEGWEQAFRGWWAWHPRIGGNPDMTDHDFVAACQRADLTDYRPKGTTPTDIETGAPLHISYVFVQSCEATPVFDTGKTAVHELGHFMGIDGDHSDDQHPTVLAHPHRQQTYDPDPLEEYGCLMDYYANQGNAYCEFCTYCVNTVRQVGTR